MAWHQVGSGGRLISASQASQTCVHLTSLEILPQAGVHLNRHGHARLGVAGLQQQGSNFQIVESRFMVAIAEAAAK
jgi:hypothetical protein